MARQSQAPTGVTILLTRPEPGASATAAALRRAGAGATILLSPLMSVQFLTPALPPGAFSAVIFTSRAGVAAAVRLRDAGTSLPRRAYAVGDGTAAAALAAGFVTLSARGDAQALAALIAAEGMAGPLLHLRGKDAGETLGKGLVSAGIETHEALAYAQLSQPLTAAAQDVLRGQGRVILPLLSPRSARLFHQATVLLPPSAPLDIVAMSAAVAEAAAPIAALHRVTAVEPTEAAMVQSVMTRLRQNPDLNGRGTDH